MKLYHAVISGGYFKFYSLCKLGYIGRELNRQEKSHPFIDSDKHEAATPRGNKEIPVVVRKTKTS